MVVVAQSDGNVVSPPSPLEPWLDRLVGHTPRSSAVDHFLQLFESESCGVALVDPQGRMVAANPALQELLGYDAETLARRSFVEFAEPRDATRTQRLFGKLLDGTHEAFNVPQRFVRPDGTVLVTRLTVTLGRDADGRPCCGLWTIQR